MECLFSHLHFNVYSPRGWSEFLIGSMCFIHLSFFKKIFILFLFLCRVVYGSSVSARKAAPDPPECWSSAGAASASQDQALSAAPLLYSHPFPAVGLKKGIFSFTGSCLIYLLLLPLVLFLTFLLRDFHLIMSQLFSSLPCRWSEGHVISLGFLEAVSLAL